MRKKVKRLIFDVTGLVFILIGLAGFVLPLIPGFIFLLIGVYILSLHSDWVRGHMHHWRDKHPKVKAFFEGAEERMKVILRVD